MVNYNHLTLEEIQEKIEKNGEILDKIWAEDDGNSWEKYQRKCQPYWDDNSALYAYRALKIDRKDIKLRQLEDWEKDEQWVHIPIEKFKVWCENGLVTSYDGSGYYATETEVSDLGASPSAFREGKIRTDFTHVCWYNK